MFLHTTWGNMDMNPRNSVFSVMLCTVSKATVLWLAIILYSTLINQFLPERDYVTFGSLLSQFRLSSVCRLSVTLVHPTQRVDAFGSISSPLCTLAIL